MVSTTERYPNWFKVTAEENFERHLLPLEGPLHCLQVGAFTGNTSVWLLDRLPGSTLVDVDTWQGSRELSEFDFADVERTYDRRMAKPSRAGRVTKVKGTSEAFFAVEHQSFDFAYIDGGHDSYTAINDLIGACRLLKPGALLAVDDYNWTTVALAVDAFEASYAGRVERIDSTPAQAWFRKVADQ